MDMSLATSEKTKQKDISARKALLAEQLRASMDRKGWGPTETARQASSLLPDDQSIAPASISHYCSGRAVPRARQLEAIATVLGISPENLGFDMPPREFSALSRPARVPREDSAQKNSRPTLVIEDQGNGTVRLEVNQEFSWSTAMKILEVLKTEMGQLQGGEDKPLRK